MTEVQHLGNAPIKEALIDIRVSSKIELNALEQIHELIADRYPKKKNIQINQIGFSFSQDQEFATSHNLQSVGYRYETDDGRNVLQIKVDGFTFSRLEPYEDWDAMVGEARGLWDMYVSIVKPESVTRIAVRYINSIPLPLPINDFGDFITAAPIIPAELPQSLSTFLTRINIIDAELGSNCVITQTLEEGDNPQNVIFVLDIDVVISDQNKVNRYESPFDSMWSDFSELRDFKNMVFFNSITDKTKEMLK